MKTIPRLLLAVLLAGVAVVSVSAAAPVKPKTYTVTGFVEGAAPSPALLEDAARAVGKKMPGLIQIQNADDADHVVEILFRRGKYQIFVDALPLKQGNTRLELHKQVTDLTVKIEMFNERNMH